MSGKETESGNSWINTDFDLSPIAPFGVQQESGNGSKWADHLYLR